MPIYWTPTPAPDAVRVTCALCGQSVPLVELWAHTQQHRDERAA